MKQCLCCTPSVASENKDQTLQHPARDKPLVTSVHIQPLDTSSECFVCSGSPTLLRCSALRYVGETVGHV